MCCRTDVLPLNLTIAEAVLKIGMFVPTYFLPDQPIAITWSRELKEEGTTVVVSLTESFHISITPSISTYSQHEHKRLAAAVCFEIAAKYAEKVDGEIIQRGTVAGCRPSGQSGDLLLAKYPSEPLLWESICTGFAEVLNGPIREVEN